MNSSSQSPKKKWQDSIDNPIYNQLKYMGIVELMSFVNQKNRVFR